MHVLLSLWNIIWKPNQTRECAFAGGPLVIVNNTQSGHITPGLDHALFLRTDISSRPLYYFTAVRFVTNTDAQSYHDPAPTTAHQAVQNTKWTKSSTKGRVLSFSKGYQHTYIGTTANRFTFMLSCNKSRWVKATQKDDVKLKVGKRECWVWDCKLDKRRESDRLLYSHRLRIHNC